MECHWCVEVETSEPQTDCCKRPSVCSAHFKYYLSYNFLLSMVSFYVTRYDLMTITQRKVLFTCLTSSFSSRVAKLHSFHYVVLTEITYRVVQFAFCFAYSEHNYMSTQNLWILFRVNHNCCNFKRCQLSNGNIFESFSIAPQCHACFVSPNPVTANTQGCVLVIQKHAAWICRRLFTLTWSHPHCVISAHSFSFFIILGSNHHGNATSILAFCIKNSSLCKMHLGDLIRTV